MLTLRTRSAFSALSLALALILSLPISGFGQTFRGGIVGAVTDQSGAAVAGAQVIATEASTNTSYKVVSSSAGEFAFANVPLGSYAVTVTASGF
jgi:hypothetical protein